MSRDEICFHANYQKILRLYGFEEPNNALTYPCDGFTPYSASTTALPSVTTEAVTVSSTEASPTSDSTTPATEESTAASTDLSTITDENIVTELTQTSQTVMLFNTTTSADGTLQESNSSPTTEVTSSDSMLRTEVTFPQESFTASETLTSSNSFVNPANLSSTQTSINVPVTNEKLNEPLTTETTETSPKTESVTLSLEAKTIEPSGSETVLVPNFSSLFEFPVDFTSSESAPEAIKIKSNRTNATRSLFKQHKAPTISQHSQNILDKYKNRNLTNINDIISEIERDLKFNSSERNTSFPDDLLDDLLASTKALANSSEGSISSTISNKFDDLNNFFSDNFTTTIDSISSTGIFKKLRNDTRFKLFNDSLTKLKDFDFNNSFELSTEKFDHDVSLELIPFNDSALFFNSSTEINLNETSPFYDTLFGLIENATQSIKDFIGFSTTTIPPISNTLGTTTQVTVPSLYNSTAIKENDRNHTLKNQVTAKPTLASENNLNKSEGNEINDHILPKKSITGENENIASEYMSPKASNYVNVLSLKQSKLTSTKFSIKGIHPPKHVTKRNRMPTLNNHAAEKHDGDIAMEKATNLEQIHCNVLLDKGQNNLLCKNIPELSNITQTDIRGTSGKRKARSIDRKYVKFS